jgi:hypothetical protein
MEENEKKQTLSVRTIYDATNVEVFWKNFLVGFGHALGALVVNIILYIVVGFLFIQFMLPYLSPLISGVEQLSKSVKSLTEIKQGSGIQLPKNLNLQKFIEQ